MHCKKGWEGGHAVNTVYRMYRKKGWGWRHPAFHTIGQCEMKKSDGLDARLPCYQLFLIVVDMSAFIPIPSFDPHLLEGSNLILVRPCFWGKRRQYVTVFCISLRSRSATCLSWPAICLSIRSTWCASDMFTMILLYPLQEHVKVPKPRVSRSLLKVTKKGSGCIIRNPPWFTRVRYSVSNQWSTVDYDTAASADFKGVNACYLVLFDIWFVTTPPFFSCQGRRQDYVNALVEFIEKFQFSQVVLLASADAGRRTDAQITR